MTTPSALHTVRAFLSFSKSGNFDAALALLAVDISWRNRGLPAEQTARGRDQVLARVLSVNAREWRNFAVETEHIEQTDDDSVLSLGSYRGTHVETARTLAARFTHRWVVRHGAITAFDQTVEVSAVREAREVTVSGAAEAQQWVLSSPDLGSLRLEGRTPEPGADTALVRVEAVGLNFADIMQAEGRYPNGPKPPYVPGFELCGRVLQAEPGADLQVGERVLAVAPGALSHIVQIPNGSLRRAPTGWGAVDAAAHFVRHATAHACTEVLAAVRPGERVLVTAAASSVGLSMIALARAKGAHVFGTVSNAVKRERARQAGLVAAELSSEADWSARLRELCPAGFDVILDSVGGDVYAQCLGLLRPFGRLVVYGNASGKPGATPSSDELLFYPRSIIGFELGALLGREDAARYLPATPILAAEAPTLWPFELVPSAFIAMQERRSIGKQVVVL